MRRRAILFLLTATLLSAVLSAALPQRIVSTTPSITEILYALGLGDRVVGVTRFCRRTWSSSRTTPCVWPNG
jgi:iron complex transport system substrate-binding protein